MQKTKESERTTRRAKISWEQSQIDLTVAKSCMKTDPDKSSLQSTQSAINALSAVLEAHGHFQLPAYSTMELLDYCVEIDAMFEKIRSACHVLDSSLERDPFSTGPDKMSFTASFARGCWKAGQEIQATVRTYWNQHKERFFAP